MGDCMGSSLLFGSGVLNLPLCWLTLSLCLLELEFSVPIEDMDRLSSSLILLRRLDECGRTLLIALFDLSAGLRYSLKMASFCPKVRSALSCLMCPSMRGLSRVSPILICRPLARVNVTVAVESPLGMSVNRESPSCVSLV